MKLSKKIKYLLFSSIGIISIGAAAIATPLIVLKQNDNYTSITNNNKIDAVTSNKLASFSKKWEIKTKDQQDIQNQFNQFLNYDSNDDLNSVQDITLLAVNGNTSKHKQLMIKISKGLKKLSISQQNQIKNGMLEMHELTKNNPITNKNMDLIYGHFISKNKINEIKTRINSIKNETSYNTKCTSSNQKAVLFNYNQNLSVEQWIGNLQTGAFTASGVAMLAAAISVLMWFCDFFGITTYAALGASCVAALAGIIAVGLGIQSAKVKAQEEGHLNESLLFAAHCTLMSAPIVSASKDIIYLLTGLSGVSDSFGWIVPAIFSLTAIASFIITTCLIVRNS